METVRKTMVTILVTGKYVMLALPHAVEIKNGVHLLESIIRGMHVIQDSAKLVIGCLVENVRTDKDRVKYLVKGFILKYTIIQFY